MKKSQSRQVSSGVGVTSHSLLWPSLGVTFILTVTRWLLGLQAGTNLSRVPSKNLDQERTPKTSSAAPRGRCSPWAIPSPQRSRGSQSVAPAWGRGSVLFLQRKMQVSASFLAKVSHSYPNVHRSTVYNSQDMEAT